MNVFIAGGSGAIGRELVPMLVAAGHAVVALTRTAAGAERLRTMGASAVIGDVFDGVRLGDVVAQARPEVVIHQLTAFGATQGDPLAETIRIREHGTRNLVAAARQAGARRFIAQSISFVCTPLSHGLTDEQTPLYLDAPAAVRPLVQSVASLEQQTLASGMAGLVLRYGWFYGQGTNYDPASVIPGAIRRARMPIVGQGEGTYSFVHVRDAASATMAALARGEPGIYNIVDDAPAKLRQWLPLAARLLGAPMPTPMNEALARQKFGDLLVYVYNEQSGASNQKAKAALRWQPSIASWETGFKALYSAV
jgi:nucleoside-diphosphate-sugar epimerase